MIANAAQAKWRALPLESKAKDCKARIAYAQANERLQQELAQREWWAANPLGFELCDDDLPALRRDVKDRLAAARQGEGVEELDRSAC